VNFLKINPYLVQQWIRGCFMKLVSGIKIFEITRVDLVHLFFELNGFVRLDDSD